MTKGKCILCGKDFSDNPKPVDSLRLHLYKTHKKQMVDGVLVDIDKLKKNEKECDHSWRMLNRNTDQEYQAMKAGYKMVCEKCKDVK